MKWVYRIFAVLTALIVIAGGATWLYLRAALPQVSGVVRVAGLTAEVEIVRDRLGIPRITAQSQNDAWFALGYVHAQDRLAQMELMRRTGRGRLAELIGSSAVETDRFLRTLGLVQQAEASLAALSDSSRARLDAYAAGVNAWLAEDHVLPPEFLLLRITPEPWRPIDSILWAGLMRLQLAGNWRDELARARLAGRVPPEMIDALWPLRPEDAATTLTRLASLYQSTDPDRVAASLPPPVLPDQASNEWVVSGERTASGKPILVNDPHLGLSAPGQWYLARITAPGMTLVGATAPGVPAVVIGRNNRIAWGFTTTNADTYDLFIERPDPAAESRYLTPEGPQPFITRSETIKVRGGEDVTVTVRATRHGPVISDAVRPIPTDVLALSSPAFYRPDRTPEALFTLGATQNWDEFKRAIADWGAPMQNAVYADVDGNIGFAAVGTVPLRKTGQGWVPMPGWTGEADWRGFAAPEDMPRAFNPPNGRIANANNRIVGDNYPVYIGRDWDAPYRAMRIVERLDANKKMDRPGAESVLADNVSLFARAALTRLDNVRANDPASERALALLRGWDGAVARDRAEPLIFNMWMRELSTAILRNAAPGVFDDPTRERPEMLLLALDGNSPLCRDKPDGCAGLASAALTSAVEMLTQRLGADIDRWRWDALHFAPFQHPVFDRIPVLRDLLAFHVSTDGDYYTINRGASRISDPKAPFAHVLGAGYRAVYDMSDLEASLYIATPGQSGLPQSRHWGDMAGPWSNGRHITIDATRRPDDTVLTLAPR